MSHCFLIQKPEIQPVVCEIKKGTDSYVQSSRKISDSGQNHQYVTQESSVDAVSPQGNTENPKQYSTFQKALALSCRKSMKAKRDDIVVPQILKTKPHLSHPSQRQSLTNLKLKKYNPEDDMDIDNGASGVTLSTESAKDENTFQGNRTMDISDSRGDICDNSDDFHSQDADIDYLESVSVERNHTQQPISDRYDKSVEISLSHEKRGRSNRPVVGASQKQHASLLAENPDNVMQYASPLAVDSVDVMQHASQLAEDSGDVVSGSRTVKRKRKAVGTDINKKRKVETTEGVVAVSDSNALDTVSSSACCFLMFKLPLIFLLRYRRLGPLLTLAGPVWVRRLTADPSRFCVGPEAYCSP